MAKTQKQTLQIQFKKLVPSAKAPAQETKDIPDAGWDLYTVERKRIPGNNKYAIRTGIAMAIPEGWYGQIKNRSGIAVNTPLMVDAGVIDPGYRGEIKIVLVNTSEMPWDVEAGTKIAQIIFEKIPEVEFTEVTDLPPSDRGEKGFGSSGV